VRPTESKQWTARQRTVYGQGRAAKGASARARRVETWSVELSFPGRLRRASNSVVWMYAYDQRLAGSVRGRATSTQGLDAENGRWFLTLALVRHCQRSEMQVHRVPTVHRVRCKRRKKQKRAGYYCTLSQGLQEKGPRIFRNISNNRRAEI
jgi:hypothetical protein